MRGIIYLNPSKYGPPVSSGYPLGDFMEDYIYVPGSGDLDTNKILCNT